MISGHARLAGVIGWPVAHSLSPKLHNHWLEKLQLDGAYIPMPVAPQHLEMSFNALKNIRFSGWNLTVPHKEAALGLVDEADAAAHAIGAVNTVMVKDGKCHGSNTDAEGFITNLRRKTENLAPYLAHCVILGAGGAAKAVAYGLREAGAKHISVINRTPGRAQGLGEEILWDQRAGALGSATLLVNTTTLGMHGQPPLELPLTQLPPSALVCDIVYAPLMTPLLLEAQARGNPIVTGIGMLIHQAVPGFRAWFGASPPVDASLEQWLLA